MVAIKRIWRKLLTARSRRVINVSLEPAQNLGSVSLQALTAAALALPGLTAAPAVLANEAESEASWQYGHYEEGRRQLFTVHSKFKPIEVNSEQGHAHVKLTDRIKFAFNYIQDTWSGATPVSTAPLSLAANRPKPSLSGASPILMPSNTLHLDAQLQPLALDSKTGKLLPDTQVVHTLSMASPETRKQGDFKLGYAWDEAGAEIGGGVSLEKDYESRFGSIGGYLDLNQKLTRLNLSLSYTNSDTQALIDHDAVPYIYEPSSGFNDYNATHDHSQLEKAPSYKTSVLRGNREDWTAQLGVSQVLNKSAVLEANFGYTRSTGYLANPYKTVTTLFVDPLSPVDIGGNVTSTARALLEQRPNERNQWTGNLHYVQHIHPLDAALHFDYRLFHDDWGITAHTFEINWAQPLNNGWQLTPRIRYYSQTEADFYTPYQVSQQAAPGKFVGFDAQGKAVLTPLNSQQLAANYSSDHRLSAFGALSGGLTLSKQVLHGLSLEASAEYYTHAGALTLSGQGEDSYADFDYYMVNAALKVDLAALAAAHSNGIAHIHRQHGSHHTGHHGSHAPAGVMFDHLLPEAGVMVGYRYMYSLQGAAMQYHTNNITDARIAQAGCPNQSCYVTPDSMYMHMHMLDLMYAPTDWLTLMLMPQFMDMTMGMRPLDGVSALEADVITQAAVNHAAHPHNTGGLGDTSAYALFKLFDQPHHRLQATLGISAPTGDTDIQLRDTHGVTLGFIHYGMQLGSGTWDFKPSLTYSGDWERWAWGAQLSGTKRLESHNAVGFAYGDVLQGTAWGNYQVLHWLAASIRGVYTLQGSNRGTYQGNYTPIGPMDYADNYGGRYWDVGFGLSATVPSGDLQGNRLSVEWLQPVHDDVNGYQLPRTGALAATWSYAF